MPGLITHFICGDVCIKRLKNNELKNMLIKNRQIFNVGTQGPDIFFYYIPCLYKKSIYMLGNTLHKSKIGTFFSSLINFIDEIENKNEKQTAASYLAGYLTHYALDANTHPYIYYKSGFKVQGDKTKKIRYSVNHRNFETNIDILMLKLISSKKPSDKKLWEFIKVSYKESKITAGILSKTIKDVYDVNISANQIYNAIYSMYATNRLLQSKTGRKKVFMEFIENFTIKENIITSLIHEQEANGKIDFLNLKKSKWHYPWENEKENNHTFTELFENALSDSISMLEAEQSFLNKDISKDEFLKIIGNKSMETGIDSDTILEFKFSDVVFS